MAQALEAKQPTLVVYVGSVVDAPVAFAGVRIRRHTAIAFRPTQRVPIRDADDDGGGSKADTGSSANEPADAGRIAFVVPAAAFWAAHKAYAASAPTASAAPATATSDERAVWQALQSAGVPRGGSNSSTSHNSGHVQVHTLHARQWVQPGLVDCHVHAPQFAYVGTATALPLMQWLERYTFPAESRLGDVPEARRVYDRLVTTLLRNGTTTALYFATLHVDSSWELARLCAAHGQRALVGKVSMDRCAPPYYCERSDDGARQALHDAERFVTRLLGWHHPLLTPVLTPRFLPTCSPPLLHGLGQLAQRYAAHGVRVQSHLSESRDELDFVRHLHGAGQMQLFGSQPDCTRRKTTTTPASALAVTSNSAAAAPACRCVDCTLPLDDTAIFDRYGLLVPGRTVMAHAVHVTPAEQARLQERQVGVACCPQSNSYFGDGALHLRRWMTRHTATTTAAKTTAAATAAGVVAVATAPSKTEHQCLVGLGTDVAGGCSTSLLAQMRCAVTTSTAVDVATRDPAAAAGNSTGTEYTAPAAAAAGSRGSERITYADAFYLATAGGAHALGLGDRIGRLDAGYDFDALIVDVSAPDSPVHVFDGTGTGTGAAAAEAEREEPLADVFEKFANLGDDRNIVAVYVRGRCVRDVRHPLSSDGNQSLPVVTAPTTTATSLAALSSKL